MPVQHSSESNEHYTPPDVVEASREILGTIELDPASNDWLNNLVVKADTIYTKEHNGFLQPWCGNTFSNPPGGLCDILGQQVLRANKKRKDCKISGECGLPPGHEHKGVTSSMKAWWFKMAKEYLSHRVPAGVFIAFSVELVQTSQIKPPEGLPLPLDFPRCYPKSRTKYWKRVGDELVEGKQPTHASMYVYLPQEWSAVERRVFELTFSQFGRCVWPDTMVVR